MVWVLGGLVLGMTRISRLFLTTKQPRRHRFRQSRFGRLVYMTWLKYGYLR